MLIRCIRCKTQFEQRTVERTCGCKSLKKYHYSRDATRKWESRHRDILYLHRLTKYFQNPIYQWIREFVTTEHFTHYQSFKKRAKNY